MTTIATLPYAAVNGQVSIQNVFPKGGPASVSFKVDFGQPISTDASVEIFIFGPELNYGSLDSVRKFDATELAALAILSGGRPGGVAFSFNVPVGWSVLVVGTAGTTDPLPVARIVIG